MPFTFTIARPMELPHESVPFALTRLAKICGEDVFPTQVIIAPLAPSLHITGSYLLAPEPEETAIPLVPPQITVPDELIRAAYISFVEEVINQSHATMAPPALSLMMVGFKCPPD